MRNKAVLACALTAFASIAFSAEQSTEPAAISAGMRTDMRPASWPLPASPPPPKTPEPSEREHEDTHSPTMPTPTITDSIITDSPITDPPTIEPPIKEKPYVPPPRDTEQQEAPARPRPITSHPRDSEPFGPACSALSNTGDGRFAAMAKEPLVTAISSNPNLMSMVSAISRAQMADRLDMARDVTLFAPVNDAFKKIPAGQLNQDFADRDKLTGIVSYHVALGRRSPSDLSDAVLPTVQGDKLTVKGSGDTYTVNEAKVLCGNIQTANATVYFIDTVLEPK
ncbi:fasciclin domain-containing protein [Streptosporangium sp. CA-135522]|uniref:fasciclin domain-containing protein n=1 Tax=Streptosporangium sp. CA-135522 TaxID=3240072 RepID=UPI003D89CFEC